MANLPSRAQLFTGEVRRQVATLDLPVIDVDVGLTVDELVNQVATILHLPLSDGH